MKHLFLLLALVSGLSLAAPTVTASQSTLTSGTSHVAAVPAGAAGDTLLVYAGGDYSRMGVNVTGFTAGYGARGINACGRASVVLFKPSDGSESSVTLTTSQSIGMTITVLRVSGPLNGINFQAYCHGAASTQSNPPGISLGSSQDALFIASSIYNGAAPTLYPSGYGFAVGAGAVPFVSLAFKSAVTNYEDPGAFQLPSSVKSTASVLAIY